MPESGRVLEKFISEDERVILDLKTPKKENTILINYKYWVGTNFNDLENYILNGVKNNKNNSYAMNDDEFNCDYKIYSIECTILYFIYFFWISYFKLMIYHI